MARKYSIAQVVRTLRTHHGLLSLAADTLGCGRSTLYRYCQDFPEVAAVVEEERERLVDMAEDALYDHLREKSPWAIALVLRTLGRKRGFVEKDGDREPPVDVFRAIQASVEWRNIQSALLQALEPYPQARWAVVEALQSRIAHDSANGHPS